MPQTDTADYADRRLSLPLSAADWRDLAVLRSDPEALKVLPNLSAAAPSDAALVHAVFEAGMTALHNALEEQAYRDLARDSEYLDDLEARRTGRGQRPRESAKD